MSKLKFNLKTGIFSLDKDKDTVLVLSSINKPSTLAYSLMVVLWGLKPNKGLNLEQLMEAIYPLGYRPDSTSMRHLIDKLRAKLEPYGYAIVRPTLHEGYRLKQVRS